MNELTTTAKKLPQTIEEKTAFVLFGSDALNAYRKKLKAIQSKYGISSEQYKQIQLEAQETAENLLLFSADIGKEMQKIKTAQGFASSIPDVDGKNAETKTQTIHSMGFTDRQARDFQTLAKHPESVQRAIEDARKEDRIVTRQDVFHDISNVEYPTRRQKEAQELREAKKRAENFENSKVVAIGEAKQNKDDNEKLFAAFNHDFENMIDEVRRFSGMATDGRLEKEVKRANKYELHRMADHASELYRAALKIQRVIAEVIDEE